MLNEKICVNILIPLKYGTQHIYIYYHSESFGITIKKCKIKKKMLIVEFVMLHCGKLLHFLYLLVDNLVCCMYI